MFVHVVKRGDTIWSIARRYNVSPQRIISDNAIPNPQNLVLGQALLILIPKTVHTVTAGDTLPLIAMAYDTSVLTLMQNNPVLISNPVLVPGQTLVIDFTEEKRRSLVINSYAYPYINQDVLRRALPYLTYLTIFGYGFTLEGDLIEIDDQPLINLAYEYRTAPVMLISSITEEGTFSGSKASVLFNDVNLQNKVIDNIIDIMVEKGYVGLDVDFEYIEPKDGEAYLRFLENVISQLHPMGFFVNTDLAPKTSGRQAGLLYEAHNYPEIGAISDTVLLMTYEWGYTYGPPLPVSPLPSMRRVLDYAVTEIDPSKLFLGISNYGYDFTLPYVAGESRAQSLSTKEAVDLAVRVGAEIQYDETAMAPFFFYTEAGVQHQVYFEDARSIRAKLLLLPEYGLRGALYWNLMRRNEQNLLMLNYYIDILRE